MSLCPVRPSSLTGELLLVLKPSNLVMVLVVAISFVELHVGAERYAHFCLQSPICGTVEVNSLRSKKIDLLERL